MQRIAPDKTTACILLEDRHAPWSVCGAHQRNEPRVYARGYATSSGQFVQDEQLAQYVQRIAANGAHSVKAEIPNFNGGWALVIEWPHGEILAAVDRMRSVPLFYYHGPNELAIAASGQQLAERFSRPMSVRTQLEFLLLPYVMGSETLYDGVEQLQSGELLHFQSSPSAQPARGRYYRFYPDNPSSAHADKLSEELAGVIQRMFERCRDGLSGKRVVVPLSGGLDSRLVVGMLKRVGVENCVCFTYGDEGAKEVEISRLVAEALGYEWRYIRYTPEVWAKWNRAPEYKEFWRYTCKGVSQPHVRDFPAVMQLAEEGLHGSDVVYFPGHSADMNAGSHIPPDYADIMSGRMTPSQHILRGHSRGMWDDPMTILNARGAEGIPAKLAATSAKPEGAALDNGVARCEMWNAEQRQAKYIINSVRTYEFVGSPWRTLWDYEFMDFFLNVPEELRYGMKLYLDCLRRKVFVNDLAPLGAIPIEGRGSLQTLTSIRPPARRPSAIGKTWDLIKRQVRLRLLKAGVSRQRVSKLERFQTSDVRLSGLGITDSSISFEEALDRLGALPALAPEVRLALRPWLGYQLHSLRFAAVFGTMVLAEMSQKGRHND
jgi:asparagine synthase (glutamine-hydrolysing)